ncbi:molybdopterin converting factor subunit 1 [Chloroflexota bacterium]
MKVKVRFFARLRELAAADGIDIERESGLTVGSLKDLLKEDFPQLTNWLDTAAVAVNGEYAQAGLTLKTGDEVAFLPPFSGGGNVC